MHNIIFLALVSVVVSRTIIPQPAKKSHGAHTFDLETYSHLDFEPTNEFALIRPENIKFEIDATSAQMYNISSVSTTMITNDGVVTVTFNSANPSSSDWIGAYSPANVSISTTVPIKYGYCDEVSSYLSNGNGYLTFNLTNVRSNIKFYYFTGGLKAPTVVASSKTIVSFQDVNQPLRPRVVPTGNTNVLKLLWGSATSTEPELRWGTTSGNYVTTVSASTTTFTKLQMCGPPANTTGWRNPGLIHSAEFTGMNALANQKLFYIFGDSATNDFSREYIFHVPPLPGHQPPSRPTTVVLYDDMGRGSTDMTYTWNEYGRPAINTSYSVGNLAQHGMIDAVYHGGDISYATGYMAVWDFFLDMISPIASSTLYLSIVGNHESDWPHTSTYYTGKDSGGECGIPTLTYLPQPYPATVNQPWWSYDIGLIHFVGMSTEHNYTVGSKQYNWIENDLKNVNRTKTPWVLFGGHRAMYIDSNYGGYVSSDITVMNLLIQNIEPLLWKYRVNIGFYGHNHAVQRQSAVLNKTVVQASTVRTDSNGNQVHWHVNPQATVHMVIGTAGAGFTENYLTPAPLWNELVFYRWGYAVVTAVNSSYLYWEWIDSSTNNVIDRMVITQNGRAWNRTSSDSLSSAPGTNSSSGMNDEQIVVVLLVIFIVLSIFVYAAARFYMQRRNKETMPLLDEGYAIETR